MVVFVGLSGVLGPVGGGVGDVGAHGRGLCVGGDPAGREGTSRSDAEVPQCRDAGACLLIFGVKAGEYLAGDFLKGLELFAGQLVDEQAPHRLDVLRCGRLDGSAPTDG